MIDDQTELARKTLDSAVMHILVGGMLIGAVVVGPLVYFANRDPEQLRRVSGPNIRWVAPAGVGSPTNTGLTLDSPWDPETAWRHSIHGREFYFLPGAYGSITAAESYSNVFGPRPWVPARPR